ncbi:ParA family protein [Lactococcus lactis]|uniref:ParA family protein n=1 Tax=Lactococcus lactis TaxID=1358 RepID=UPI00223C385F|nr:AAA family ATPase [Lactococcus lactis]MCT0449980.1 chromosome partitioning protein ParA [Lactococcus lactis subsp. lactis]
MKVISLLNLKGGVGKTTTAVNLAKGLSNKGKRVLLIDTDMQANATSIFLEDEMQEDTYKSFSDLISDEEGKIENYFYSVSENLKMIGADLSIANADLNLRNSFGRDTSSILKNNLKEVKDDFDYCIIDCAPTINLVTMNSIIASDEIIVPIKIDKFALKGYETTYNNILKTVNSYGLKTKTKVLFTMVNRNNIDKQIIESIPMEHYETTIRFQAKPITESSFNNEVVIDTQDSNVKSDYLNFLHEVEVEDK